LNVCFGRAFRFTRVATAFLRDDADGYQELQPGEKLFGRVASELREGVYDGKGKFLRGFERIGTSDAA